MAEDNKFRIAFFISSLGGGGAERVILNLAKVFSRKGYQVDIVLGRLEGDYCGQVPPGVELVDLKANRVIACLIPLIKYLVKHKPSVLLSAGHHHNLMAVWAAKLALTKTKVFISEHNTLSYSIQHQKNLRDKLLPFLMKRTYIRAEGIIAVSAGVADDLALHLGIPRSMIQVIYNPIVDEELLERAKLEVDDDWFAFGQPPVVLSAGRLVGLKDFPLLLKSFALVRKEIDSRLMILGEGDKRPQIEALVKELGLDDVVSLPGFVENPYAYMKRARAFVLSSRWEGLPNVLIEAMACGTPVISTDCPSGPREILEDGQYGLLVPVGNEKAMAEAILKVLKNQPQQDKWSKRVEEFSVERITSKYLDLMLHE
jgi:glycosyltransferase involved in cell wall biosynthesis